MSLVIFLVITGGLFGLMRFQKSSPSNGGENTALVYPELSDLEGRQLSFGELSGYFKALAQKKGGEYAFDVLRLAPIPPNIDMHLLAHVVGDVLFNEEGIEGIRVCTQDFRNACSHSIVVGLLLEKGEESLPQIVKACRRAPGGSGAYTMCYHGLGHGVVAYTGYDLPRAVALCKKTGTREYHEREYIECVGGTIMEMISGGFHNKGLWQQKRPQYFKGADNPLAPCSSDFISPEARSMCYTYLTPYLWEVAGADPGLPTPDDFEKAFQFCDKISQSDLPNRDACYGGFGKEFVGLVLGRDIRLGALTALSDQKLLTVYQWCLLAKLQRGSAACLDHALQSLFWGGENDRSVAIRFCSIMPDGYYTRSCFTNLIGAVSYYIKDPAYRREFCNELPSEYRKQCETRLQ